MKNSDNSKTSIERVKDSISKIKGMTATIRSVRGRRRFTLKNCVISGVYDNIFTVSADANEYCAQNLSFTYSDILTGTIAVTVYKKADDEKVS